MHNIAIVAEEGNSPHHLCGTMRRSFGISMCEGSCWVGVVRFDMMSVKLISTRR